MKDKKIPERFSIRFDSSIPEHRQVIEILSHKGRNIARYIADAIIAYEQKNNNTIKDTVTEVVTQLLGMRSIVECSPAAPKDFDFSDIAGDLNEFRKE